MPAGYNYENRSLGYFETFRMTALLFARLHSSLLALHCSKVPVDI